MDILDHQWINAVFALIIFRSTHPFMPPPWKVWRGNNACMEQCYASAPRAPRPVMTFSQPPNRMEGVTLFAHTCCHSRTLSSVATKHSAHIRTSVSATALRFIHQTRTMVGIYHAILTQAAQALLTITHVPTYRVPSFCRYCNIFSSIRERRGNSEEEKNIVYIYDT